MFHGFRGLMAGVCPVLLVGLLAGCGNSAQTAAAPTSTTTPAAASTTAPVQTTSTAAIHIARSAAASFASQTSATLIDDGARAMAGARSYTAAGVVDINDAADDATLTVHTPDSIEMQIRESAGVLVKIILIGGQSSYLWADAGFWSKYDGDKLTASEIDLVSDRWYIVPATETRSLTSSINQISPRQLGACLKEAMVRPEVVGLRRIDGQSAVELHTDGGAPGQSPGNLWIATKPPHYPIRFQQTGRAEPGGSGDCASSPTEGNGTSDLVFSGFDATGVSAPVGATDLP